MNRYIKLMVLLLVMGSLFLVGSAQPSRDLSSPVTAYIFHIEIDGLDAGYFASVAGLSITQEVIEYQDGDDPVIRKRPGRIRYSDIILRKGYIVGTVLNDWIEASRLGNGQSGRKNMSIILIDKTPPWDKGVEIKRWNCYECFPRSWTLSALDNVNNAVLTEEMVIVIEWFEEVEPAIYVPH